MCCRPSITWRKLRLDTKNCLIRCTATTSQRKDSEVKKDGYITYLMVRCTLSWLICVMCVCVCVCVCVTTALQRLMKKAQLMGHVAEVGCILYCTSISYFCTVSRAFSSGGHSAQNYFMLITFTDSKKKNFAL